MSTSTPPYAANNLRGFMKELEERIRLQGTVKPGNVLKVDAFLNHQCDVELFDTWVPLGRNILPVKPSTRS